MIKDVCTGIFTVLLALIGLSIGPEYSAKMTVTGPDGDHVTKVFVKGDWQRHEKEGQVIVINSKTGKTYTILDKERSYMEMGGDEGSDETPPEDMEIGQVIGCDGGTIERLPSETFEGYRCLRYRRISSEDRLEQSIWYSPKLKTAIKVETKTSIGTVGLEYGDIVEGPQDPGLFSIPEGYGRIELDF